MIIGAVVQKQFMRPRREVIHCVTHLVDIYNVLAQKQVPNVDTLVEFNVDVNHPYVVTEPVGIDQFPESGTELFNAAVCVLEALQVSSIFVLHRSTIVISENQTLSRGPMGMDGS